MTTVVYSPTNRPMGYPSNCEVLHHGHLTKGWGEENTQAFFVRFRSQGRFIPHLTPDAHWQEMASTKLVRVIAKDMEAAIETLLYHYGSSIDYSIPIEVEERVPLRIISGHMQTIVEWPQ